VPRHPGRGLGGNKGRGARLLPGPHPGVGRALPLAQRQRGRRGHDAGARREAPLPLPGDLRGLRSRHAPSGSRRGAPKGEKRGSLSGNGGSPSEVPARRFGLAAIEPLPGGGRSAALHSGSACGRGTMASTSVLAASLTPAAGAVRGERVAGPGPVYQKTGADRPVGRGAQPPLGAPTPAGGSGRGPCERAPAHGWAGPARDRPALRPVRGRSAD